MLTCNYDIATGSTDDIWKFDCQGKPRNSADLKVTLKSYEKSEDYEVCSRIKQRIKEMEFIESLNFHGIPDEIPVGGFRD